MAPEKTFISYFSAINNFILQRAIWCTIYNIHFHLKKKIQNLTKIKLKKLYNKTKIHKIFFLHLTIIFECTCKRTFNDVEAVNLWRRIVVVIYRERLGFWFGLLKGNGRNCPLPLSKNVHFFLNSIKHVWPYNFEKKLFWQNILSFLSFFILVPRLGYVPIEHLNYIQIMSIKHKLDHFIFDLEHEMHLR